MTPLQQDTNAALVWPITQQGHQIAQRLAQAHSQLHIAERVRRNCLAVWVVHDFLKALGVATDPAGSDSWNPALQLMEDIADLQVPGIGVLECRPVLPDGARCPVPPEARLDRAGYVMVALDEAAATLLGFSTVQAPTEIRLHDLQAIAALPEHLHRLAGTRAVTRLGQWLEGTIEMMWRLVEDMLAPQMLQPAFRQLSRASVGLRRAKRLVLDPTTVVVLVVGIAAGLGGVMELVLQLYPGSVVAGEGSEDIAPQYLPAGISLAVVDGTGTVVLMARSKATDNVLQLSFSGAPGEAFSLRVGWRSTQIIEQFVV